MTAPWDWLELPAPHHREFARSGAWADLTVAELAEQRAEADPDGIALIAGDSQMSWAALLADARALAASLRSLGLVPGDVVSFQTPNWAEAAVINLAAALSGLVINPIVPIYRDAEVGMMLADSGAKALFTAGSFRNYDYAAMAERLRPLLPALRHIVTVRSESAMTLESLIAQGRGHSFERPSVDPGSVKMLLFTSGTTGRPKGVLHSHNTLWRVLQQSARHWGIRPGDAMLMPSPVTHVSGYGNGLELPFVAGTRTVLMESWNAAEAIALIERHEVAGTVAATPFLVELAKAASAAGKRLPSFRFFA